MPANPGYALIYIRFGFRTISLRTDAKATVSEQGLPENNFSLPIGTSYSFYRNRKLRTPANIGSRLNMFRPQKQKPRKTLGYVVLTQWIFPISSIVWCLHTSLFKMPHPKRSANGRNVSQSKTWEMTTIIGRWINVHKWRKLSAWIIVAIATERFGVPVHENPA